MAKPSHRTLQAASRNFLVLLAIATMFMIFGTTKELIVSLFLHPPKAQVYALRLYVLKEAGGSC